jgi:hypothetical protein
MMSGNGCHSGAAVERYLGRQDRGLAINDAMRKVLRVTDYRKTAISMMWSTIIRHIML